MRWSIRLGYVRGVPVEVHWLFVLVLVWVGLESWGSTVGWTTTYVLLASPPDAPAEQALMLRALIEGARAMLIAVILIVLVFVCVLIHEIGHTLHAQALGIPVRRIWLLPFGGLAELARLPEQPQDELRVAAAGPAANLGLALVLGALASVWLLAGPESASPREAIRAALREAPLNPLGLLVYLAFANLGITVFNLLPAFPLDGARMMRGLLGLIFRRIIATSVVIGLSWLVGSGLILFGILTAQFWGLMPSLGTVLFGFFILAAGRFEAALEKTRTALRRISARMAVRQPTWTLAPTDPLTPGLSALLFSLSGQSMLPVVVGARLVGVLAQKDVNTALESANGSLTVAHLMQTRFPYIRADEDLWRAQQLLVGAELSVLPVVEGETLQGVLTPDDIRAARYRAPATFQIQAPTFISKGDLTL